MLVSWTSFTGCSHQRCFCYNSWANKPVCSRNDRNSTKPALQEVNKWPCCAMQRVKKKKNKSLLHTVFTLQGSQRHYKCKRVKTEKAKHSPHTSDLVENRLKARPSGAVHLMGNLAPACAVYVSSFISLARPKSATLTMLASATRQFLAARSL